MQVTTNPILNNLPRTLNAPKLNNEIPNGDGPNKGPGFGDRFMANLDSTSDKVAGVLTPLTVMFVGGSVGRMVAGAGMGTIGSLIGGGGTGMAMAQVGSLAGGIAGSMLGYRYGATIKDKPGQMIENVTGNSRAGRALLTAGYAAILGGAITSLALGGFAPVPAAIGAGVTLAGLGGYAAYKAH